MLSGSLLFALAVTAKQARAGMGTWDLSRTADGENVGTPIRKCAGLTVITRLNY